MPWHDHGAAGSATNLPPTARPRIAVASTAKDRQFSGLLPCLSLLSRLPTDCYSVVHPGEDRGNGHRTTQKPGYPATGFRRLGSRPTCCRDAFFLRLREWRRVTSGLAPSRRFCLTAHPPETRARSREGEFQSPWDCKVTPANCVCQEGNTIGCISSNDGLDAGVGD